MQIKVTLLKKILAQSRRLTTKDSFLFITITLPHTRAALESGGENNVIN